MNEHIVNVPREALKTLPLVPTWSQDLCPETSPLSWCVEGERRTHLSLISFGKMKSKILKLP